MHLTIILVNLRCGKELVAGASGNKRRSGGKNHRKRESQGSCWDCEGRNDGDHGFPL